uniref:Uncharacterized protein n=1 Tax=Arundo donax TaxID=35708 RepID=A0A0A9D8W1_ARUDO
MVHVISSWIDLPAPCTATLPIPSRLRHWQAANRELYSRNPATTLEGRARGVRSPHVPHQCVHRATRPGPPCLGFVKQQ